MSNKNKAALFAALTVIFGAAGGGYASTKAAHSYGTVILGLLALLTAFMASYFMSPKLNNKR